MDIVFLSSLIFSSLVVLSLSMPKHYRQIFNKPLPKQQAQTTKKIAWLLLILSITFAIYQLKFGVGLAIFFNALAVVAFMHIWLISYYPAYLIKVALWLPLLSGIIWFVSHSEAL